MVDPQNSIENSAFRLPLSEQLAINAVKKWKYKPATKGGVPTSATITVSVNF